MVVIDQSARRWLAAAGLAGGWAAGWLHLLLSTTHGLPGLISGKPGAGAFELPTLLLRIGYSTVLCGTFLLGTLLILIPALLRQALDRQGSARQAFCWPIRSATLMLGMLCWFWFVMSMMQLLSHRQAAPTIIAGLAFAAVVVTPFAGWNPRVLCQRMPQFWWPLHWPGLRAVLGVGMLWLLGNILYWALNLLASREDLPYSTLVLSLFAELVDWIWPLLALGLWLGRGRIAPTCRRLRQGLADGFWRPTCGKACFCLQLHCCWRGPS